MRFELITSALANSCQNAMPNSCKMSLSHVLFYSIIAGAFFIFWTSEIELYRRSNNGKFINTSFKTKKNNFRFLHQKVPSANIFLIETSGSSKLNPRQACAAESAAHHHPHSDIQVLMVTSEPLEDVFGLSVSLPNIKIKPTNPKSIFIGTPLWNWHQKTKWKNKKKKMYDFSDAIRALLIWKYGGIYLDLDTVTLRTFTQKRNFLVKSYFGYICNGIFGFERHHPFLSKYLAVFEKRHVKNSWGSTGPRLFTDIFKSFCQHRISEGTYSQCNLTLLSPKTAFPVHWGNWKHYFNKTKTKQVAAKMKDSYMIHVWNYLSSKWRLSVNSGTLYEKAIKDNCPIVYKHLVEFSLSNSSFSF